MIQPGKISIALFLILLSPGYVNAQHFKYAAALNEVDTTGFYTITMSPLLGSFIKTDFSDVRIADQNGHWVPHILQQGNSAWEESLFTSFPILQNTVNDSGKNLLVIENTKPGGINKLKLILKNAAVNRSAILSGSFNRQHWYVIDDYIMINRSHETIKDEYIQEIILPLVKYQYLKLVIDNVHNDPLLITKAGFYALPDFKKPVIYQVNPAPLFTQKDSNNYSYIEVKQEANYQFDKISINASGARFYSRDVQICLPEYGVNKIPKAGFVIGNFKLMPATTAVYYLLKTKTSLFYIVIKNGDSPPLKIENISTELQTVALVAYLDKGKKYKLVFGDSLASFADYDLQSFKDSITTQRALKYGNIYATSKKEPKTNSKHKNWWIWPSIILAGLTLVFLTFRLTADINKAGK